MKSVRFCELMNMPSTPEEVIEFTVEAKITALGPLLQDSSYVTYLAEDVIQEGYIYVHKELLQSFDSFNSLIGNHYVFKGFTGTKPKEHEMPLLMMYEMKECAYA